MEKPKTPTLDYYISQLIALSENETAQVGKTIRSEYEKLWAYINHLKTEQSTIKCECENKVKEGPYIEKLPSGRF